MPSLTQISAGSNHSAFLDHTGRVFTCGLNAQGQLGVGNFTSQDRVLLVTRLKEPCVQVACGTEHTLFLARDGTTFACGQNSEGQLGVIGPKKSAEPQTVPDLKN